MTEAEPRRPKIKDLPPKPDYTRRIPAVEPVAPTPFPDHEQLSLEAAGFVLYQTTHSEIHRRIVSPVKRGEVSHLEYPVTHEIVGKPITDDGDRHHDLPEPEYFYVDTNDIEE